MPSVSSTTPPSKSADDNASMETEIEEKTQVTEDASSASQSCDKNDQPQIHAASAITTQTTEKPKEEEQPTSPSSAGPSSPTALKRSSTGFGNSVQSETISNKTSTHVSSSSHLNAVSEWSHQQLAPAAPAAAPQPKQQEVEVEWQTMPAYAPFDIFDDDGRLIAKENQDEEGLHRAPEFGNITGFNKGYTRVQVDDDAQSANSFEDNTAYLFKEPGTNVDEDEDARDVLAQMQATKDLLNDNQRIAYVGVVRLAMSELTDRVEAIERTKNSKKQVEFAAEAMKLWSQKMMVRLYGHMELEQAEQIMIEQLAQHGLRASDLAPTLKQNARVKNPLMEDKSSEALQEPTGEMPEASQDALQSKESESSGQAGKSNNKCKGEDPAKNNDDNNDDDDNETEDEEPLPAYEETQGEYSSAPHQVQSPSDLPQTEKLDIDIRWTILCDLFLILIANSTYDARSRSLFEKVGSFLDVSPVEVARFEKRIVEALEMEEEARKEDWNESSHMEERRKQARKRRLALMGLATVGGGLVIGLSAGILAPVIGAGLASGFGLIGISGTGAFLGGVGGAAAIGAGATVVGGTIGVRAANRRTGAVKTFEYRPLHNNRRVNIVVTVAGWMNGKVDDVRLPFSTVDPVMGDMYAIHWEPEMLRSMGDTINILATEALTQGLQQILGSTILISLMAALQLPIVLTKLSYLIDNPWSNSLARAEMAGLILADSLIDRNLGARPVTLVGFSIGSRVIISALRELANKGAVGLVQDVILFGTPAVARKDEYLRARTVVSGRFVNGYATNDWILGYLFRATAGGIGRVAGLAKVEVDGIENIDVTQHVPGHMAYRQSMPKLLQEIGWAVTSLEFTEIEDPDPENHERRQRELINEIEEARKEIHEKKKKKRFDIFGLHKKWLNKREWETYDERVKAPSKEDEEADENGDAALFDVEAIRKEAAQIAAEGLEIKELESTMPPLKVDSSALSTPPSGTTKGVHLPYRATQSHEGLPGTLTAPNGTSVSRSVDGFGRSDNQEAEPSMSFEPADVTQGARPGSSIATYSRSPSPTKREQWQDPSGRSEESVSMTFETPQRSRSQSPSKNGAAVASSSPLSKKVATRLSRSPSPTKLNMVSNASSQDGHRGQNGHPVPQPQFKEGLENAATHSYDMPLESTAAANVNINRNIWADEEDETLGNDNGVTMTFE